MYIQCFDPLPKGPKGEREAEDDLEKDCQERTIRGRVDELENGQISGTKQGGLDRQHDGLMCLLAWRAMMVTMRRRTTCFVCEYHDCN